MRGVNILEALQSFVISHRPADLRRHFKVPWFHTSNLSYWAAPLLAEILFGHCLSAESLSSHILQLLLRWSVRYWNNRCIPCIAMLFIDSWWLSNNRLPSTLKLARNQKQGFWGMTGWLYAIRTTFPDPFRSREKLIGDVQFVSDESNKLVPSYVQPSELQKSQNLKKPYGLRRISRNVEKTRKLPN